MLMSAIDSAGWRTEEEEQKTYSLLAVFPLPSPSHQYAPRSRGSHHAIFAPCLWPRLVVTEHIRLILFVRALG